MFGTMARLIKPCSSSNWLAGDTRFRLTRGLAYDGALARTPAKRVRLAVDPGLGFGGVSNPTKLKPAFLFFCVAPFRFAPRDAKFRGPRFARQPGVGHGQSKAPPWLCPSSSTTIREEKDQRSRPTLASRQCGQSSVSPTPAPQTSQGWGRRRRTLAESRAVGLCACDQSIKSLHPPLCTRTRTRTHLGCRLGVSEDETRAKGCAIRALFSVGADGSGRWRALILSIEDALWMPAIAIQRLAAKLAAQLDTPGFV